MAVPKKGLKGEKGLKGVKSSKTAHVLNLLTAPDSGEKERETSPDAAHAPAPAAVQQEGRAGSAPASQETAAAPEAAPAAPAAPAARPLTPPTLEIAPTNDDQIAAQIRAALEEELNVQLSDGSSASAPEPEPQPQAESPKPAPEARPEPAPALSDDDFIVLNVMEKLVELKAPRYTSMFGLCTCDRCMADVRALTLSHLQPHYIVVSRKKVNAMITVYESRFNSTIFAQLTRSCKVVMDNPRHDT